MEDENKVVAFLNKVKDKKIEGLMGLAIDIHYYEKKIASLGNEDDLRDKLSTEQEKAIKDGTGRIITDKRDMDVISKLNADIAKLQKLNSGILEAKDAQGDVKFYLSLIDNMRKDLNEETLEVSKVLNNLGKL